MMSLCLHVRAHNCTDCIVSVLTSQMNALSSSKQTSHSRGEQLTGEVILLSPQNCSQPVAKISAELWACSKCFGCFISKAALDRVCWQRFHFRAFQMAENWRPWLSGNWRRLWWNCIDAHPIPIVGVMTVLNLT